MYACLLLHLNNGTDRDLGSPSCSCSRSLWLFFMGLASILRSSILCAHPSINSTLYLLFAAFPIVYQQQRGWSPGVGNLAFIGKRVHHRHVFVLISAYRCCGRLCDWSLVLRVGLSSKANAMVALTNMQPRFYENPRYSRIADQYDGFAPPEARLHIALIGAVLLPIGVFVFAWTAAPTSIPWIISMIATVPFGT
jgi:hypothetical protein